MEDKAITASYVMLQLNLLKDEILKGVEEKIRKVVQEELETIRTEFDEKLQNFKTEQQAFTEEKFAELKEMHQIEETSLSERLNELENQFKLMLKNHDSLLQRDIAAEDRQRRTNIVVTNLKVNKDVSCEENAENFFRDKLNIPQEKIKHFIYRNCHYLGREQPGHGRSLIIAFIRQTDRDYVMSQAKKLKGSDISMRPNYSAETRARKDEMLKLKQSLQNEDVKLRVVERSYQPLLQIMSSDGKWSAYDAEF